MGSSLSSKMRRNLRTDILCVPSCCAIRQASTSHAPAWADTSTTNISWKITKSSSTSQTPSSQARRIYPDNSGSMTSLISACLGRSATLQLCVLSLICDLRHEDMIRETTSPIPLDESQSCYIDSGWCAMFQVEGLGRCDPYSASSIPTGRRHG